MAAAPAEPAIQAGPDQEGPAAVPGDREGRVLEAAPVVPALEAGPAVVDPEDQGGLVREDRVPVRNVKLKRGGTQ